MKNITLSIDEKVLATVRRYTVAHEISVNRLVRDFLTEIAQREDRARKARKRIRELSEESSAHIGVRKWSRAELHDR